MNEPLRPLLLGIFMRDYNQPRLMTRLLARENFPLIASLEELNRIQLAVTHGEYCTAGR
jgi:hypothetical protein